MNIVYGFFFNAYEEKSLFNKKEAIRLMKNPTMYDNDAWDYSIILSEAFENNFTNTAEYDVFFEAVVRLFTDSSFIENGTYEEFFISNLRNNTKTGYVEFIWNNETKFMITNDSTTFRNMYPLPNEYFVVYDEDQTVENGEMLELMVKLCGELGRENIYTSVKQWNYVDTGIKISFYIFYSGGEPSEIVCKEVIRDYLLKKYTLEKAKELFPRLFIDTQRRVFCIYDNEKYPIKYDLLADFIDSFNIISPEIVHMLDYVSPLVIEYGLSDVFTNFKPIESEDYLNNNLLFYITQVLNYYNGKVLDKGFIEASQFCEYEDYCSVVCANIEWQVMKKSYTGSYFISNNDENEL